MKNFVAAMKYIRTLDFFEAELCLKRYGKALLSELPKETTQLLKDLCTHYEPTVSEKQGKAKAASAKDPKDDLLNLDIDFGDSVRKTHPKAVADEYLHIFIQRSDLLVEFLEYVISQEGKSNYSLAECGGYSHFSPILFFVFFLSDCSPVIYTTLLEAYLRETDETVRMDKCLSLLRNPRAKFDNDQALVLCQMYDFGAGVQLLYQKMELYQEIVSHFMEHKEYKGVLDACASFGERDPMLWVQALSYFA